MKKEHIARIESMAKEAEALFDPCSRSRGFDVLDLARDTLRLCSELRSREKLLAELAEGPGFRSTPTIRAWIERCRIWLESVGWGPGNKTVLEQLALISGEIGEAVNECRGDRPSDEFPEELADVVLRCFGLAANEGIDLASAMEAKMAKNEINGNRGRKK